ncbi:MAG: transcriptional regulator, IclR family, partial [Acidimicrobiales bacterium]|nr:transcriptional regulator, IclR family [Acidimicrobiales bacterium]
MLNFLAAHPNEAFTLSDIADRLDINLASTHALLTVLIDAGYANRHPRLRTFTLGASVVALGSAALEAHPAIDLARDAAR